MLWIIRVSQLSAHLSFSTITPDNREYTVHGSSSQINVNDINLAEFSSNLAVMRISRQPFPVKIMIDQKQLDNVESFKYLGSILINSGRCTCEIKCRIAMAKAAFNKTTALFTSTLDLELRKKLVKCYIWSIAL
jgi:hypothetical protein